jgi:hypothetical protein
VAPTDFHPGVFFTFENFELVVGLRRILFHHLFLGWFLVHSANSSITVFACNLESVLYRIRLVLTPANMQTSVDTYAQKFSKTNATVEQDTEF